ncbi:MAG: hypothetical protein DMG02_07935 [Acidobacteria bacterium]|nr:MAG: hypothetical protein DMG03_14505 [Acidobacteriota bacterium]PYQ91093.1 MAG: hypothetical protein DMG02_07935 [Acidobacteriota bacterium]PYR12335.1 MAG: hypothetical protein DMF99_04420 [Acidobacteriota bacterium]
MGCVSRRTQCAPRDTRFPRSQLLQELARYTWPGNVRELRNIVERLLLLTGDAIDAATVRQVLPGRRPSTSGEAGSGTLANRVATFERDVVLQELAAHGHRVTETARALGLERSHLYKKCQQLGIDLKTERTQP